MNIGIRKEKQCRVERGCNLTLAKADFRFFVSKSVSTAVIINLRLLE